MKKVLVLAYDFPPYPSVGGLRPKSWYDYMHHFDVYPIVITRQWENKFGDTRDYISKSNSSEEIIEQGSTGTIIRSPYYPNLANRIYLRYGESRFKLIRQIVSGFYDFFQHFIKIGPKVNLYYSARKFLKKNKVDAIIATGDPFILFNYAHSLSKEFEIPWYADYRDDWIQNHTKQINYRGVKRILSKLEKAHERRYMKNVSGFTTVSKYLLDQIERRTQITNNMVIENGADLKFYTKHTNPFVASDFNIVYTGMLYDLPYLDDFWIGYERFLIENDFNDCIKAIFIGIDGYTNQATRSVYSFKKKYKKHVTMLKRKKPEEIAQYQLHAQVLLNMIAGDPEKGLIGAKSYNYALTGNPILTIPYIKNKKSPFFPNRDIQFVATSADEVYNFLSEHYVIFKEGNRWESSLTDVEKYKLSREYNTEKLIKFLFKSN